MSPNSQKPEALGASFQSIGQRLYVCLYSQNARGYRRVLTVNWPKALGESLQSMGQRL